MDVTIVYTTTQHTNFIHGVGILDLSWLPVLLLSLGACVIIVIVPVSYCVLARRKQENIKQRAADDVGYIGGQPGAWPEPPGYDECVKSSNGPSNAHTSVIFAVCTSDLLTGPLSPELLIGAPPSYTSLPECSIIVDNLSPDLQSMNCCEEYISP